MTPKISVLMITYNHEKFIGQALEGVLAQKTNFDFEIVAGEDCSTDKTREILLRYQARYPNIIRPLLHEKNVGANRNLMMVWQRCQAPYIALLEGDDFWTDKTKLQAQVDFLDRNPSHAFCFHDVVMRDEEGCRDARWKYLPRHRKTVYSVRDFIKRNFVPTCSVVLRKTYLPELPPWFEELVLCDWPLFMILAHHGPVELIDLPMAVYRIHGGSMITKLLKVKRAAGLVSIFHHLDAHFEFQYHREMKIPLAWFYFLLAKEYLAEGKFSQCFLSLCRSIKILF